MLPALVLGGLALTAAAHALLKAPIDKDLDRTNQDAIATALTSEKDPRQLEAFSEALHERGYPLAARAIGDRARAIWRPLPELDLSSYPLEYWLGKYRTL